MIPLYVLAACIVLGAVSSPSFAASMLLLLVGWVLGAWWRGLTADDRRVSVVDLTRVPKAVAQPAKWRRERW